MRLPGGIPLRVRPEFFLVALVLGMGRRGLWPIATWVLVCLVSVIVHECGHAYLAKAFGYEPSVQLWGGGGVTRFARPGERVPARTDVLVSLAGPGAGFAFGALAVAVSHFAPAADPRLALAYDDLSWVNLTWGALNLLPVIPLDGSHLALRALERLRPETAVRNLLILSVALCAVAGAAAFFWLHWQLGALYALWLAWPSGSALVQGRSGPRPSEAGPSSPVINRAPRSNVR
ncbi:MAG: site-2 protease family protein [Myxococcales bacterium]